jgi:ribosomal protein L37AE/L43A
MPTKPVDPAEAQVNADLAAAHAEKAADEAEKAERKLAEATKDDPKAKLCPVCTVEMVQHEKNGGSKSGCWHCNTCGECWKPDLSGPRYP